MARIKYWNETSQAWEYADKSLKIDNNLLIDKTLTIEGKAADAKAVGDAIADFATETYVDTKVASMVDSAPDTLNTLNELASALGDDPNFATTIATQIGGKANSGDLTAHTGNKSNPHGVTAAQVGAVPTTRKVNGKALSSDISLTASDVGALPSTTQIPSVEGLASETYVDEAISNSKDEMFTIRETVIPNYTNQIPISIDENEEIVGLTANSMLLSDGSVSSGSQYVTGFIPVKKGDIIRVRETSRSDIDGTVIVALYNVNKENGNNIGRTWDTIPASAAYGNLSISGNVVTWDTSNISYYFWGENFAWLRVTVHSADAVVTINEEITESVKEQLILKPTVKVTEDNFESESNNKPLAGKTVVCFGDSLFGMNRGADSAPNVVAEYTGATVHNVGFGGCRMSVHPSAGYAAFSMWALAKAIAENNWTTQDAQSTSGSDYFPAQLALLKSIDFNNVDIAVIHYGTNDFGAGNAIQIDNANDLDDYNTLCGALRYSIEKLLNAYPKLQIYVSLPAYRFWTESGTTIYAEDYVRYEHTLIDFVEALRGVASEYNLPVIDCFNGMGVNKYNAATYLSDGTHHNIDGRKLFGEFIGGHLIAKTSSNTNIADKTKLDNTNIAYGTCSTAAETAEKAVVLNGNTQWSLKTGSIIMVKFDVSNTASNVTLNVNGTGAKSIYFRGAKITADVIKAGDVVTFVYSSYYHLISIDRWQNDISELQTQVSSFNNPLYVTVSNLLDDWTASHTITEMEKAYQANRPIFIRYTSSTTIGYVTDLMLTMRYSATNWLFSGFVLDDTILQVRISDEGNKESIIKLAKNSSVPTDDHINSLIDAKLSAIVNAEEVAF